MPLLLVLFACRSHGACASWCEEREACWDTKSDACLDDCTDALDHVSDACSGALADLATCIDDQGDEACHTFDICIDLGCNTCYDQEQSMKDACGDQIDGNAYSEGLIALP